MLLSAICCSSLQQWCHPVHLPSKSLAWSDPCCSISVYATCVLHVCPAGYVGSVTSVTTEVANDQGLTNSCLNVRVSLLLPVLLCSSLASEVVQLAWHIHGHGARVIAPGVTPTTILGSGAAQLAVQSQA